MTDRLKAEDLLARVTEIGSGLPGVKRKRVKRHACFRVRDKTFAYFLNDHHGDDLIAVCANVLPGDNVRLVTEKPMKFYLPAYIGPRGWVGLRLDRKNLNWGDAKELIATSYWLIAPKELSSKVKLLASTTLDL